MTSAIEWLEEARRKGYFVGRHGSRRDAWFRDCESRDAAYICVRHGRRYSTVDMDLIGQSFKAPEESSEFLRGLLFGFAAEGADLWLGPTVIGASKVRRDRAEELAHILVHLARRWKKGRQRKAAVA